MTRGKLRTLIKDVFERDFDLLSDEQLSLIVETLIDCNECPHRRRT